jgi:hypothetical protein
MRFFSTLITILLAGAIGFGVGVYVTPPDKAAEFHTLVNDKLDQIKDVIHSIKTKQDGNPSEKPQVNAPVEPEPVTEAAPEQQPSYSGSNSPCDPTDPKCATGAPSEAAAPMERVSPSASEPSAPMESGAGDTTPLTSAAPEPAAPSAAEAPAAEPVAKPAPVKAAAKPVVKKPKPKPKPVARPVPAEPVDLPAN